MPVVPHGTSSMRITANNGDLVELKKETATKDVDSEL